MANINEKVLVNLQKIYTEFIGLTKEWNNLHEEGSILLNDFEGTAHYSDSDNEKKEESSDLCTLHSMGKNMDMSPIIQEDTYQEIKNVDNLFENILMQMYACKHKIILLVHSAAPDIAMNNFSSTFDEIDYLQMFVTIIKMYENEFQHKLAIISSIAFDTPQDTLTTLRISWGLQPFLGTDKINELKEVKHE